MDQLYYQKNLVKLFLRSIAAVNPGKLISENLRVENGNLHVCHKVYDIKNKNIYLVGFGKAVLEMAVECEKILGQHLKLGVVCCPQNIQNAFKNKPEFTVVENSVIKVHEGAKYNLPDENAERGADEIVSLVKKLHSSKDHLIVLISGGGSALFTKPKPGISLNEKVEAVKLLVESGANINELNSVRKRLSSVKGGGLGCLSHATRTTCLILSDVINDPIDVIASGPTVPLTDADPIAFNIIKKYNLENKMPENVLLQIKSTSQRLEFLTDDNKFPHLDNFIIGNNSKALTACKKYAEELGFQSVILSSQISGSVQKVSEFYNGMIYEILNGIYRNESVTDRNDLVKDCCFSMESGCVDEINRIIHEQSTEKKMCIIAGGETTVKLTGNGLGGRNQELALRTSAKVHDLKKNHSQLFAKSDIMFLFGGTDGIDGPTDAAGAIGGSFICEKAKKYNLNIQEILLRNDSYNFFNKIDCGAYLIKTGHTGTNVMDIHIIFIYSKAQPKS